ncbi:hypothetical protein HMPREF9374_2656 [Desmospora sp. 8437]|nr:hypothetical protein HMPREF9374_2656 [Desmospora sp. 8437]
MQRGLDFTWSDFGSSEQRKRHVKPNGEIISPALAKKLPIQFKAPFFLPGLWSV